MRNCRLCNTPISHLDNGGHRCPGARNRYITHDDLDERDSSGDFLLSAVIGAATDSALLGGLLGGSFSGGILGDILDGDLFD